VLGVSAVNMIIKKEENPEKQKDEIGPNEKINFHKQST